MTIPCWLLAFLASSSIVNRISSESEHVYKWRVWYADLIRIPGNPFLRFRNAPVTVLSAKRWHQRERELADATIVDGKLKLKRLPGETLAEYLLSDRCESQKSHAIATAINALLEFHNRFEQSHGDATAGNVMIRELHGDELEATWFDFDVAHVGPFSDLNRADDLRALLTTSGQHFEDFLPGLVDVEMKLAFEDLKRTLSTDIFHLAQRIRCRGTAFRKTPTRFISYKD